MKIIKSIYADIIENMDGMDIIRNALAGSCNLYASYLNDYSTHGINDDVATFLYDCAKDLDQDDIRSILDNPDYIIIRAAEEFRDALATSLHAGSTSGWYDARDRANDVLKACKACFDSWGAFYVFADPISNAWARYYIIRSDAEHSALEELITRFESDFIDEDADEDSEDVTRNDNGNIVNIDNLQFITSFKIEKA